MNIDLNKKKVNNPFFKVKNLAETQWMLDDANVTRKNINELLKMRFDKYGYTFGYKVENDLFFTEYDLDFGNIVIGTTKKKQFKIINTGEYPLTFEIDNKLLRKYNLKMEPEKLLRIPPKDEKIITMI